MDEKLNKIHTIYDLMIYAYEKISGLSEERILSYYLDNVPGYRRNINFLFREVMMCNLTVEEFVKEIAYYLESDSEQVCMHILMEFDHYYEERDQYQLICEAASKVIIQYPVKNNISSEFAFYPMFQNNFIMRSAIMAEARVHRIRDGIWDMIKSYRVVRITNADNIVMIRRYRNRGIEKVLTQSGCLTMALIPFSNQEAFEKDEKGILKYNSYDSAETEKIYGDCSVLLEKLDNAKVDIVIFPEIVMSEGLVLRIKEWLQQKAISGTNLKLVFMGSYYSDGVNRCVLFSGTGKLLLSNDKQNGFGYFDNENDPHRESLGDKSDVINLIDIKGLGRVWYLICKDALLYSKVVNIVSDYGCNVQAVSAYSRSVSDFQATGESLAKIYQAFSAVCNSCAVRKGKDIGVISYPVYYINGKNISSSEKTYSCRRLCEACAYCKCAHIWQFYVNEKEEGKNHKSIGLKITYNQWDLN